VVIIRPNNALSVISNNLQGAAQGIVGIDSNEQKKNRDKHFLGLVSVKLGYIRNWVGSIAISTFTYWGVAICVKDYIRDRTVRF
jgi:hypothetical protein